MSKRWFNIVWLIWFVIFSVLSILLAIPPMKSSNSWVYFINAGDSVEVLKGQDYFRERNARGAEFGFARVIYEPVSRPGPIRGFLELYFKESAFAPGFDIYPVNQVLTNAQQKQAHQALIQYANADPKMVLFRPGQPAQTLFSWNLLSRSLIRLSVIALIALAITLFIRFVVNMEKSIRRARKQHGKMCVHCSYQIVGLTSAICPECGKEHGAVEISSVT